MTMSKYILGLSVSLATGALGYALGARQGDTPSDDGARSTAAGSCSVELDYEELAAQLHRLGAEPTRGGTGRAFFKYSATPGQPVEKALDERQARQVDGLNTLMSYALETGTWSRASGSHAQGLSRSIPPSAFDSFSSLLHQAIERGDIKVQSGAWVPNI